MQTKYKLMLVTLALAACDAPQIQDQDTSAEAEESLIGGKDVSGHSLTVGGLFTPTKVCVATLVKRNAIVTAAECVESLYPAQFFVDNEPSGLAVDFAEVHPTAGIAVAHLIQPVSEDATIWSISIANLLKPGLDALAISYAGDARDRAKVLGTVTVTTIDDAYIHTRPGTATLEAGDLGSPLVLGGFIFGVHIGGGTYVRIDPASDWVRDTVRGWSTPE